MEPSLPLRRPDHVTDFPSASITWSTTASSGLRASTMIASFGFSSVAS